MRSHLQLRCTKKNSKFWLKYFLMRSHLQLRCTKKFKVNSKQSQLDHYFHFRSRLFHKALFCTPKYKQLLEKSSIALLCKKRNWKLDAHCTKKAPSSISKKVKHEGIFDTDLLHSDAPFLSLWTFELKCVQMLIMKWFAWRPKEFNFFFSLCWFASKNFNPRVFVLSAS